MIIERDDHEGTADKACPAGTKSENCFDQIAKFKRIYKIEMTDANANGPVRKIADIDLMKIADPDKKARKALNDGVLTFPFFTIENVDIVDGDHIVVGNDNNLPFSSSRDPNKADDNEFVLLQGHGLPEGEVSLGRFRDVPERARTRTRILPVVRYAIPGSGLRPARNDCVFLPSTRGAARDTSLPSNTLKATRRPMIKEPILDIAHLAHLELLTPKFDESRDFFINVMGMTQSAEKGDSVYLRGWDDYERYSLKLTASKTSGLKHVAYRCRSPQALERRAAALKGSGFDIGWTDGDVGHGKTFVCKDPDDHVVELYYETEWYQAPPEQKPALKNQAQRFPARGCNVRRLDHWNGLAVDIKANRDFLRELSRLPPHRDRSCSNDGSEAAIWMTATNKSYDFAYTRDHTGTKGRFHHITYALDTREEILRAADIFLENGVHHRDRSAQARDPADLLPLCL